MRKALFAALGLAVAISAQTVVSSTASAMELGVNKPAVSQGFTEVQFRRCRFVRRECRARWGGGWRYRRCVIRRGCA